MRSSHGRPSGFARLRSIGLQPEPRAAQWAHQMPSSRKMEPSLTIVVPGTDGSSFSLNASTKPFLCTLHTGSHQRQFARASSADDRGARA